MQVDADYRPNDRQLSVVVEVGAGGSAALAFSAGAFSGQVFITLSVTISYRMMIGKPGGGLSLGSLLVIAGYVNVAGIVDASIVFALRMIHRENGQIDGQGSVQVSIRICRFFTLRARANANYKLRGGKAEAQVTTSTSVEADRGIAQAAKKLQQART